MAGQGLQRREMLRVMAMASVAAHLPGFKAWAFAGAHPSAGDSAATKPSRYQPIFFSDHEYPMVECLTELIIPSDGTPGAREAGVAEFVDFMTAHDPSRQYPLRTGLTWLNAHSERLLRKPFLELSEQDQISLLEPLAYKAKNRPGEEDGRKFFANIKELTVMGFYTSKIGYEELDNPALKFYAESPECPHKDDPEHKHLPAAKW